MRYIITRLCSTIMMLAMMVAALSLTACGDDDNESKSSIQTVEKPGVFGNLRVTYAPGCYRASYSFSYRADGSIERAGSFEFSEDQKTISREAGDGLHTWVLTYNSYGLVSSIKYTHPKKSFYSYTADCLYDNNGRLQTITKGSHGEGKINLVWENDCIVTGGLNVVPKGVIFHGYRNYYTFTHSNKGNINQHRQYSPAEADMLYDEVYGFLGHLGLLGVGSAYYPDTYTWIVGEYTDGVPDETPRKMSYTFNEEGLIDNYIEKDSKSSYTYVSKFI